MDLLSRLRSILSHFTSAAYPWPAMDLRLPGGQRLHLVGSIHMGTQDMAPLPGRLLKKLQHATALIVEADISTGGSPFTEIEREAPLETRLPAAQYQQVVSLCAEYALPLSTLDTAPLWQIALILQAHQAQRLGLRASYGIDYQLLEAARRHQVPVQELEGTQNQVELLTALPNGGQALLSDTLAHWDTNARMLQIMIGWWLATTARQDEPDLPETFSQDLHHLLIDQRNQQWCTFLHQLPPGEYVVAVGALHLYGEGNVPSLLKSERRSS